MRNEMIDQLDFINAPLPIAISSNRPTQKTFESLLLKKVESIFDSIKQSYLDEVQRNKQKEAALKHLENGSLCLGVLAFISTGWIGVVSGVCHIFLSHMSSLSGSLYTETDKVSTVCLPIFIAGFFGSAIGTIGFLGCGSLIHSYRKKREQYINNELNLVSQPILDTLDRIEKSFMIHIQSLCKVARQQSRNNKVLEITQKNELRGREGKQLKKIIQELSSAVLQNQGVINSIDHFALQLDSLFTWKLSQS